MKQVLLDPSNGSIEVADVPVPSPGPRSVLVRSAVSIISPGTERLLVGLASKSAIGKAKARPEAAKQLVDTVRREGLRSAYWKAQARLGHPFALGYSSCGAVVELGRELVEPGPGTRVACGGAEHAVHAEFASVSPMLAVPVPEGVTDTTAAMANIGAIALHALRTAEVGPGGCIAVVGLGLLGQLAAQLAAASGIACVGIDPVPERRELAARLAGCEVAAATSDAGGWCEARGGVDAVIVAAATDSTDLLDPTVDLLRDRGRIVVLGAVPVVADRDRLYRKEISLTVARSSGAGRYEPSYEDEGVDLPVGHVRWTEGRNIAAFMDLAARGRLRIDELVTHRFPIARAAEAYELIEGSGSDVLGVALDYPETVKEPARSFRSTTRTGSTTGIPRIGVIGAGTFARSVLLPRLQSMRVELTAVATATGASATGSAKRFGFRTVTTDPTVILGSDDIDAVVIATRHGSHAELAAAALSAGKHVFVEKPLALTREQLGSVLGAWGSSERVLSVGFNRRFAPLVRELRDAMRGSGPITGSYVVNVAPLPTGSWILDPEDGGGVVMAEGGHFIDTITALIGQPPVSATAVPVGSDSYVATLGFADGSVGTVTYTTRGGGHGPKELLTIAGRGVFAELTDFRTLTMWPGGTRGRGRSRQDKGHGACLAAWVDAISGMRTQPVAIEDIAAVSEATIAVADSIRLGTPVSIDGGALPHPAEPDES